MGCCDASSLAASIPRDSCTSEFVGVHSQTELRTLLTGIHRCHVASASLEAKESLEAVKGNLRENDTISELDFKLAGPGATPR